MKKVTIIILAILPIFLVITISFAGRFITYYQHVSVESVRLVNDEGVEYDENYLFILNVGEQKQIKTEIYPENATNKNVFYLSDNNDIFVVDDDGYIRGIAFGSARLIVKSEDGSKFATLLIKVTQDHVTGVSFTNHEIEINVGEQKSIVAVVEPYVAINKSVEYSTSDSSIIEVDSNGVITAIHEGQAIIKVRTVDGGFEDTCVVICIAGIPALCFDCSEDENFIQVGEGYILKINEINLINYLKINDESVTIDNVKFRIKSGSNHATLSGSQLHITGNGVVVIVAYVGSQENPTYQTELRVMME